MSDLIDILLEDTGIKSLLNQSESIYLGSQIDKSIEFEGDLEQYLRLLYLLISNIYSEEDSVDTLKIQDRAYVLLKSIPLKSSSNLNLFQEILGVDDVDPETFYFFILASLGLKSDKAITVRLDLEEFHISSESAIDWRKRVLNNTLQSLILLVRKSNGFDDIRSSLRIIDSLQKDQKSFETNYLQEKPLRKQESIAFELLGLYHLTKPIVEVAKFLIQGYGYKERLEPIIRQHIETARKLLVHHPRLVSLANIIEENLNILQSNSIWTRTKFNDNIKRLCEVKVRQGWLELLPSQREALSSNLLDVASNVTVLQMPTSAGKTLLAEFNILITKALKQDSKIVYVVPSRALVNQIYFDLKSDLEGLDLIIEKTSSAIEVDPTENSFLVDEIDVLVSTPEKLDLLIRRDHESVRDISLFIIDEAHTIQNGQRGAKLELLLAILKRERPEAKFMLLSPFLGSKAEIVKDWLGGGNSIAIDWKPSQKLITGISYLKPKTKKEIKFELLPSPYWSNESSIEGTFTNPYELESSSKKDQILEFSAKYFTQPKKTTLILCQGRGTADKRADFLYDKVGEESNSEEINLVRKYIEDEVGKATTLSKVLSKRIAIHHAGLSDESKLLIEHLIRSKEIRYVCSTTTVADGVNFPVSTVFFDSLRKGNAPLDSNDFWNISGRAGRTMIDNFGKIVIPFHSKENVNNAKRLIQNSSNDLVSVLAELFVNGDSILEDLASNGLGSIMHRYYNSVAPLVQYFVHLLTVGGAQVYSSQIEDLFKDSLEYYLLDSSAKKNKFIEICKAIYLHLQDKYSKQRGVLSFADKTGFSVPSVLAVMAEKRGNPEISNLESWHPHNLFNSMSPRNLTEKVEVIAKLRETKMGTESDQAPFNPSIIAKVLISWVNGEKLFNISNQHPAFSNIKDENKRVSDFIKKMGDIRFKASWGLSALEGIVKGDIEDMKDSYIPSLVYFGVNNEKSLMLRMVGVPRSLSNSLSGIIEKDISSYSFSEVRKSIGGLTNNDWDDLKPKNSSLDGQEWKRITEILVR